MLGSGIAGCAGALALARTGARVLVVERGRHPRFAIGESMVPTTTHGFDLLAGRYRIPELNQLFRYPELKALGCRGWPKRHFWFGLSEHGRELERQNQLVFDTFRPPRGPDVHLVRADADHFLVKLLPKYGVTYLDQCQIQSSACDEHGVELLLRSKGADERVRGRLVLDASGHSSYFADQLGLRERPTSLRTDTRAIFGHFRGLAELDAVLGKEPELHYRRDGGTMHHCFEGGWIWVIPFDDGVASVGAVLDRSAFPHAREGETPWQEMRRLIAQFPSVEQHLGDMFPIITPIGTERIQFSSTTICTPGVVLSPHAAGFVDPLFSSGFLLTVAFLLRFVPLAQQFLEQKTTPDEVPLFFRELERCYFAELEQVDRIVSATLASFRSMPLLRQVWRTWVGSTYRQFVGRVAGEPEGCGNDSLIYGAGSEVWGRAVLEVQQHALSQSDGPSAAAAVKEVLDAVARADALDWPLETDQPMVVDPYRSRSLSSFLGELRQELGTGDLKRSRLARHLLGTGLRGAENLSRYTASRARGGDYHRAADRVRELRT